MLQAGFADVAKDNFFTQTYTQTKRHKKVKTPYKTLYKNIVFGNYILAQLLCESQKQDIVSGSTIVNLRQFNNASFTDTFGDIHCTIPFVYRQNESFDDFEQVFGEIYSYFLKGDNINNSIYKKYPHIPENLKKYEFYLDDNLKFSNNFLGAIRENDIAKTIESLVKRQYALASFSQAKLYTTFFVCGDELIFIPITQNLLNL